MRKTTTPGTVEITDPKINTAIQPESQGIEWLEDFGTPNDIISIRLHRYKEGAPVNNQGFHPFVISYENPPTLDVIKEEHGGGNYMLIVKYRDPDTDSGQNMKKVSFIIEGEPKISGKPPISPQTNGLHPISSPNGQETLIDTLIKLKQAGLIPDSKPADSGNAMILELMKQMHETNLANINKKGDSSNDTILQTLLKSALEKNKGELDDFEKWVSIIDKMKGSGADESEIMQLVKAVAPALLPAMLNRKPQAPPPRQMVQQQRPPQLPPGSNPVNNGAQETAERLKAENAALQAKLNGFSYLENFSISTLDDISDRLIPEDPESGQIPEDPYIVYKDLLNKGDILHLEEFNFYLEKLGIPEIKEVATPIIELTENNNLNNTDMFGFLKGFNLDKFIQGLQTASFDERVITLKQASNMFSQEQIYNFCLKNEVVKDVEDFNQYMTAAGIETYQPTAAETT